MGQDYFPFLYCFDIPPFGGSLVLSPLQAAPPFEGLGLLQVLDIFPPSPSTHRDQPPFTEMRRLLIKSNPFQ